MRRNAGLAAQPSPHSLRPLSAGLLVVRLLLLQSLPRLRFLMLLPPRHLSHPCGILRNLFGTSLWRCGTPSPSAQKMSLSLGNSSFPVAGSCPSDCSQRTTSSLTSSSSVSQPSVMPLHPRTCHHPKDSDLASDTQRLSFSVFVSFQVAVLPLCGLCICGLSTLRRTSLPSRGLLSPSRVSECGCHAHTASYSPLAPAFVTMWACPERHDLATRASTFVTGVTRAHCIKHFYPCVWINVPCRKSSHSRG